MIGAKERYQIQMNTGAFCKTEAVQTYQSLLKQRRRWFLGFITNEVCMLTDIRLWRRYPILLVVRFMQNTIRTTALLFFILVISLITTSQKVANLPVGFIAISLGLNWLLMLYFGAKLGRYKIMLYPLMFIINPFFNWVYMVYGIFTAGQRTWGGPRADAGAADTKTTPQQAIEAAEANGDDLNVVPETFKQAAETQKHRPGPIPLQPSDAVEGRFAAAERLPNGWYQQANDSGLTLPNTLPRNPNVANVPLHPRSSMDSFTSGTSANNSIYMPRRVESFMDPEDARIYHKTQQTQKPAGGAFFEEARQDGPYEVGQASGKSPYAESVNSLSDDSIYQSKGPQRPSQHRYNSDDNRGRNNNGNSPLSAEYGNSGLEAPKAAYSSNQRDVNQRSGRSPLARQSYVRTAPGEGVEMELQAPQQTSLMRDVSPSPLGQPQIPASSTHSRSESTDSKKRKRLSKAPPSSRR
jgi:chitin synthase